MATPRITEATIAERFDEGGERMTDNASKKPHDASAILYLARSRLIHDESKDHVTSPTMRQLGNVGMCEYLSSVGK